MKRKLRWMLIPVAVVVVTAGGLYEHSTHTLRGWWSNEATYQGRPTSYWRASVEAWRDRFDSPSDAERFLYANSMRGMISSTIILYKSPRPTPWTRVRGWFSRRAEPSDNEAPAVLSEDPAAEPVLTELAADPELERLVRICRGKLGPVELLENDP
jgi:hypothetical protein